MTSLECEDAFASLDSSLVALITGSDRWTELIARAMHASHCVIGDPWPVFQKELRAVIIAVRDGVDLTPLLTMASSTGEEGYILAKRILYQSGVPDGSSMRSVYLAISESCPSEQFDADLQESPHSTYHLISLLRVLLDPIIPYLRYLSDLSRLEGQDRADVPWPHPEEREYALNYLANQSDYESAIVRFRCAIGVLLEIAKFARARFRPSSILSESEMIQETNVANAIVDQFSELLGLDLAIYLTGLMRAIVVRYLAIDPGCLTCRPPLHYLNPQLSPSCLSRRAKSARSTH